MARIHQNWLRAFCSQLKGTEVPLSYVVWSGIWTISSVLGNQVCIRRGTMDLHPNMYVWLIGPPRNGKGYAAQTGMRMLDLIPTINKYQGNMSVSYMTKMLSHLRDAHRVDPDYRISFALYSDELAVTLGHRDNTEEFLRLMTQIYGATFEYGTHMHGNLRIEGASIGWLALTTMSWLRRCISPGLVESGFVSRLIAIVEPLSDVIEGSLRQGDKLLFATLAIDLANMLFLKGEYVLDSNAESYYLKWYEESRKARLKMSDETVQAIYGREDEQVLKVAMCLTASQSEDFVITKRTIRDSIRLVEAARMSNVDMFQQLAVGSNTLQMRNFVFEKLASAGKPVAHTDLLRRTARVVPDARTFRSIIDMLKESRMILEMRGAGNRGVWYLPANFDADARLMMSDILDDDDDDGEKDDS